jgi:SPASM domain peptide maturase of grasp-with-spasm system
MRADAREPVFQLFACCLPVKGARRSLLCDVQRQAFQFIPNGLYEILTEHAGETVAEIKVAYGHEYDEEIDEYFDFLLQHEFGFWCDGPERFPPIDLTWEAPERITNAILDVDARSDHDYAHILGELDDLGCKALEVRCFHGPSLAELRAILEAARYGRLRSIDLLVGFHPEFTAEALARLAREHQRISSVVSTRRRRGTGPLLPAPASRSSTARRPSAPPPAAARSTPATSRSTSRPSRRRSGTTPA